MYRLELDYETPVKAVIILPQNWISKLLLRLARFQWQIEFTDCGLAYYQGKKGEG